MKTCCVCKKEKGLRSFKNSAKTRDLKVPYCKACEYTNRVYTRMDKHNVAFRMWRSLVWKAANEQAVGDASVMYMNKDLFMKWLYMNPTFKRLWNKYKRNNQPKFEDIHVIIKDRTKAVEFKNLRIELLSEVDAIEKLYDPEGGYDESEEILE